MSADIGIRNVVCVVLACTWLAGCGSFNDDDGMGTHQCTVGYNSAWSSFPADLTLEHYQPELCPVDVEESDPMTVGGSVIESDPAPTYPALGLTASLVVEVFDSYSVLNFSGSGSLGYESESFDYPTSFGGDWMAQAFVNFDFANNPDWLEFRVQCYSSCGFPAAYVEINNGGPE